MTFARAFAFLAGLAFVVTAGVSPARAAETFPPPPRDHFNDYAGLVRPDTARQLNAALTQFERDTSNQLLVAIFPKLPSDSSVEDYTVRLAQSWRAGQKDRKNGAVLFVFRESRDVRIQVGYGLEGALPDALCKQIIENEIIPRFRAGDFDAGLTAGVNALMSAARGEYRGTGRTNADGDTSAESDTGQGLIFLVVMALIVFSSIRSATRRQTVYGRRGRRTVWSDRGGWGGGFGGFGGGGSGGGGGSFSGGGGSFGGGGAGGKW